MRKLRDGLKLDRGVSVSGIIRRSPIRMGVRYDLSVNDMGVYEERCVRYIACKKRQQKQGACSFNDFNSLQIYMK